MAGLKKKKREKSGSPNVVLVVFLVLFIISTITLGVFLYMSLDERLQAQKAAENGKKDAETQKTTVTYYRWLSRELRAALGYKLDAKDIAELALDRETYSKGGFDKVATDKDVTSQVYADLSGRLSINEAGYKDNYPTLLEAADKQAKDLEGKANTEAQAHLKTKELIKEITKNQDKIYSDAMDRIAKGNAASLAEAKKKSAEFVKLEQDLETRGKDLAEESAKFTKEKEDFDNKMRLMTAEMNKLRAQLSLNAKEGGAGAQALARAESAPLILDISPGKPLWDVPVGKITRVDLDLRQVVINVGSAHGAKPELTFNVFGVNSSGRAEKGMRGSIEIVKVIDTNSSLARITSLYDAEGFEINLGVKTAGRASRETEAPIREGDLLFNMFWGARVAVAGYVSITGEASDNPSEQNRHMEDFLYLLKRNGVQVDAWVDLRDGQIHGNITSKTRYLIRGDDLRAPGEGKDKEKEKDKMPAEGDKDKDAAKDKDGEKDKEPAPAAKNGLANADRNEQVNRSNQMLRNDARSLGLLVISAENFSTMIGYRRPRSANSPEITGFRPSLPYAGTLEAGQRQQQAPMPEPEKKAPPEPEKKDGN